MKLLVTGATGFLGSRFSELLEARGHEILRLARPGGAPRAGADEAGIVRCDAGDPEARRLVDGCDAVLHFAGVPDPARAREDPTRAVRENVGATLNLLEGCRDYGAALVYPSTLRAALDPPPDSYALSKRLGEEVCRLHDARALVLRFTSVYGPGQVAWEGATGAIAAFAARALEGRPIVVQGDPQRRRDFVYVDAAVPVVEALLENERLGETVLLASGHATPLLEAAELVRAAAGTDVEIETPGGDLPAGENDSYEAAPETPLPSDVPLEEGVRRYVDWLKRHPAAEGRAATRTA